jgi:peptidoglycan hydrolase-like protein with peptidoglycan-binding domain
MVVPPASIASTTSPVLPSGISAAPESPTDLLSSNLFPGDRGDNVISLQQFLIGYGYLEIGNATGFYGDLTMTSVKALQKALKIVSSGSPSSTGFGAVGPRTRAAINAMNSGAYTPAPVAASSPTLFLTSYLRSGSQGSQVVLLRKFLIRHKFLASTAATGFYGSLTTAAVKSFQRFYGLANKGTPATTGYGAVGPKMRLKINSL